MSTLAKVWDAFRNDAMYCIWEYVTKDEASYLVLVGSWNGFFFQSHFIEEIGKKDWALSLGFILLDKTHFRGKDRNWVLCGTGY